MTTSGVFNFEIRMLPNVHRTYVVHKSDISEQIQHNLESGNASYRTSLVCECSDKMNVRHSAAVVIDGKSGMLTDYVIRCKGCFTRSIGKEAENECSK